MWDPLVASKNVLNHVLKEREKALECTVCNIKLFRYYEVADDYIMKLYLKKHIVNEMVYEIWQFFYQQYQYCSADHQGIVKHHLNYKEDISIPVCSSCHSKIHMSSDPVYDKWKPVDERPKKVEER